MRLGFNSLISWAMNSDSVSIHFLIHPDFVCCTFKMLETDMDARLPAQALTVAGPGLASCEQIKVAARCG